jgi:hypothetical protein
MAKIGRNDPCLCGSGKKYKKCCESLALQAAAERARAAAELAQRSSVAHTPLDAAVEETVPWDDDDLTETTNSVLDLINEKRFDEALAVCERLRVEFPDVIDWLDRSALVHEARGDLALAIDFNKRALAFTEQPDQRDGFDEDGRDYFRQKIAELEARLAGPPVGGT